MRPEYAPQGKPIVLEERGNTMGLLDFLRKRDIGASENPEQKKDLSIREAEIISREFGQFLADKLPVIKDIQLLPYPKERIMKALNISIQQIQNHADPEASQLLNALESCRVGLSSFAEINPHDREAVTYFNQFPNAKAVPEHRKGECLHLIMKYMKRGMGTR